MYASLNFCKLVIFFFYNSTSHFHGMCIQTERHVASHITTPCKLKHSLVCLLLCLGATACKESPYIYVGALLLHQASC